MENGVGGSANTRHVKLHEEPDLRGGGWWKDQKLSHFGGVKMVLKNYQFGQICCLFCKRGCTVWSAELPGLVKMDLISMV